ncbi:hypothetical protein T4D_16878 [Trichinella pseudospiralis]|uniref:Uncharacterized protein n=1 Tax=Trichinella pseudospiralis TaxID=6337 RepID=A0A0V1DN67_TRIPS|nr:hypothetical protein T4D_16878 [Trichinella pseudospiralis]
MEYLDFPKEAFPDCSRCTALPPTAQVAVINLH